MANRSVALSSSSVVLIESLALDGLRQQLQSLEGRPPTEQRRLLTSLSKPLRIGVHELANFRPGFYSLSLDDFEPAGATDRDARIADVDSGALVVADLAHLARVASVLTWERYDKALQAPQGDYAEFQAVQRDLGRSFFAILHGSVGRGFEGDGAYRLRAGGLTRIE